MLAPLVPVPGDDGQATFLASLPKQNALRLKPKAGTTLPTLQPVLRWKKGPRGTKLYNLQIFQVTKRKGNAKPKVTKVLSRFPRGLQFRAPKKGLKPGTCYVWRVWPYTGTAFTTRPVGVSNFCVASSKVLAQEGAGRGRRAEGGTAARRHRRAGADRPVRSRGRRGWARAGGRARGRAAGSRRPPRPPSRGVRASGRTITKMRVSRSRSAALPAPRREPVDRAERAEQARDEARQDASGAREAVEEHQGDDARQHDARSAASGARGTRRASRGGSRAAGGPPARGRRASAGRLPPSPSAASGGRRPRPPGRSRAGAPARPGARCSPRTSSRPRRSPRTPDRASASRRPRGPGAADRRAGVSGLSGAPFGRGRRSLQ